eukprot:CAMPEP_0114694806 /NCGR_PEP_ID=MMETSP0191-20121206/70616_1 /TAXON_ID=126664 /ORGANISM="Sorites sp." /LENGTH=222 /DNA_ID=CAMNT_0001990197 /DNA_START=35 /DNA_END=703 /DNA_ORIENTATION=-
MGSMSVQSLDVDEVPGNPPSESQGSQGVMDHLKSMVADSLSAACWDGSLQAALAATKTESLSAPETVEARVAKPVRPPSAQARSGAVALLQVMSSYDRRIGKILECIHASEQEILHRKQQMAMLQVQLEEAQNDLRSLDQVWEEQQLALEREEARDSKLQEEKQRLTHSLELEKLKHKHAAVDLEDRGYARSELTSPSRGLTSPSRGPYSPAATPWSWRSQP